MQNDEQDENVPSGGIRNFVKANKSKLGEMRCEGGKRALCVLHLFRPLLRDDMSSAVVHLGTLLLSWGRKTDMWSCV